MALNRQKKEEKTMHSYEVNVTKVKEFDWGISLSMEVNGITIHNCVYKEGKKKDGTDYALVSLPSYKGSDGNYYNHVFFPISKELVSEIEKQIEKLLNE